MRKTLLICAITLLAACSGGGLFEKEKKYTPLYVYYNPLPLVYPESYFGQYDFPESHYPDFLNYPDDRVKHGLRGNVKRVEYPTAGNYSMEYVFNNKGQLEHIKPVMGGPKTFRYDNEGRLVGVYEDGRSRSDQKFEYDATGRLTKRDAGAALRKSYSYYEDGTLKAIIPDSNGNAKDLIEFDPSGNLVRMKAFFTSNPFMYEAAGQYGDLPSVSTYTYTDGLCTEKLERIASEKDSITCRNLYTYNDKGDLTAWEYFGGIYQTNLENRNQYVFLDNATLKVTFEYEYDNHGNWTTMRVILPEDFMKLEYFIRCYDAYLRIVAGQKYQKGQENPVLTVRRNIEYHASTAEEEWEMKKKDAPKFTAAQGRGLYGDVKSVTDGEYTVNFDEYGNVIGETWSSGGKNIYDYESPFRYALRSETSPFIGPFRIICEGNIRKEEDEKGIEGTTEYEFDKHGRVIRYRHFSGMMPVKEQYTYSGRDKLPEMMTSSDSYEEGEDVTKYKYTYLETDKQGNWTKRKVIRTVESTMYGATAGEETTSVKTDPEFTEARTITYY